MERTENGRTYIVTGDYPNGRYCKQIKNKGNPVTVLSKQGKIKPLLTGIDMEAVKQTDTGKLLVAVLCAVLDCEESELTGGMGARE